MPMAAIFLRNKFIAWFSIIQSLHYFLNTSDEELALTQNGPTKALDQAPVIKLLMSIASIAVCYINLVFPQPTGPPPSAETKSD